MSQQSNTLVCSHCKEINPPDDKFCGVCGTPLLNPWQERSIQPSTPTSTQSSPKPPVSIPEPIVPTPPSSHRVEPKQPSPIESALHGTAPTFTTPSPTEASAPTASASPNVKSPENTTSPSTSIQQMGESTGTSFTNPFEGKGQRIEDWSELIEDTSTKAPELIRAFRRRLKDRAIPRTNIKLEKLTAPGLVAEQRDYFIVTRDVAMVAVYIAGFGKDLYVSWALFAQGEIALGRLIALGLLSALFGFLGSFQVQLFGNPQFNLGSFVVNTITMFIIFFIIVAVIGALRQRDPIALLRGPLNEFQRDDLLALAIAVHKSLLHAIDSVGIDTKILRVKEQFSATRGRVI